MDDLLADEPAGGRAVFAEREGEGAQRVECRAGFGVARFAMREERVEADGHADGGERARPAPAHGVGHGHAHGGRGAELVVLELGEKFLEVLDGHAPRRAAAGDAREVGGVQAEFVHPRFHPRRHEARSGGVRRHRQSAHGRLDAGFFRCACGRRGVAVGFFGDRHRRGRIKPGTPGFFVGDFEKAEGRADGVALPDLHEQLRHLPSARRGHAHRRLVRLDFENVLIAFDGSPDLERNRDNRGLGDGLPELRHDDWNSRHGKWGKG